MAGVGAVAGATGGARFATHRPPAALRPYVAAAHGYRVPANPTGLHRGLPSRHLTLVIELAGPLRLSGLGPPVAAPAVIGGLHTRPAVIDATGPQDGVQYALTPSGARALFGIPAAELSGLAVSLEDVLGARSSDLVERVAAAGGVHARFAVLDEALLSRLARPGGGEATSAPAEVSEAWRRIFGAGGRARISTIAGEVGWSRRHLSEQFGLATGLTPKQAARIARFEAARRLLLAPVRLPLVELAVRTGYADQQHLAREWQALAGCSVGTWLREELPFVQDVELPSYEDHRHDA